MHLDRRHFFRLYPWVMPVAVAALLRIGVWGIGVGSDSFLSLDSPGYWTLSDDLLRSYTATGGDLLELALLRTPGYPTLLSLFRLVGDSYATAALLQALVGVFVVFLTYAVAVRLVGIGVASVAAWWLALEPLHVVESSILLTEVSFSAFLLGAILVLSPLARLPVTTVPLWRWGIAGFLTALATFVRPISLYLPLAALVVALVLARFIDRRRLALCILSFLVAFAVPVGAWFAHNYSITGVSTFSTIQGLNLALYRAVGAMIHEDGLTVDEARDEMRRLVELETKPDMNPPEVSAVHARVGIREILDRPSGYAASAARGLVLTLFGPGRSDIGERFAGDPWRFLGTVVTGISFVSAVTMFLAATIGVGRLLRLRRWVPVLLIGLPLLYLLIVGSGHESDSRFRVPLEPLLMIFAAVGVEVIISIVKRRRSQAA